MPFINPIFDRTLNDVNFARNNRNNPLPLKGAINYVDWNRITGNIHYLSDTLLEYGYNVPVTCKTSWALGEVPPLSEFVKIFNDLNKIKQNYYIMQTTPITPSFSWNHYQKINDIERIIFDVENILQWMLNTTIYSNQNYSNEFPHVIGIRKMQRLTMGELEAYIMAQWNQRLMQELEYGW